ncbi:Outer membrane protein TolC [Fodinibius salinus]|uniref:Outer membrane protein TolC n=2 Tax=Fodinibius salinus TaxID=860790 RepID=A0A5D3YNY9_9BACT|nr:Outer membrane protein TolC [Fodinibius salinus]
MMMNNKSQIYRIIVATVLLLALGVGIPLSSWAQQDTVEVSLQEFINKGLENSEKINYEKQKVRLAENKVKQARSQRILPKLELSTQHGIVPGVESDVPGLAKDEYYLDPDLENDWQDWGIFTRAEINAVQPLFSWGALKNAVNAARSAAVAAQKQFKKQKADLRLRLFDLYQSYLLTSEIVRLLDDAEDKIADIEKQIKKKQSEKNSDFDDSDEFKFEIYKSEFEIRAAEVRQNAATTQRIWNYVLQADSGTVYMPDTYFLDPSSQKIKEIAFYRSKAMSSRAEINAAEAGIEAAEYGLQALKQKNYPALFLGLTASYANTPNRPRQSNPFIINNSNYATATFGVGIRQNLNFLSMKNDLEKGRVQKKQAKYLKEAAVEGIVLEINEAYKEASLSRIKVDKTDKALVAGKKWLRQEQLDYDFGTGETKDLIDALKKELELRVRLKREIFQLNTNMAELYRKSGLPITKIMTEEE